LRLLTQGKAARAMTLHEAFAHADAMTTADRWTAMTACGLHNMRALSRTTIDRNDGRPSACARARDNVTDSPVLALSFQRRGTLMLNITRSNVLQTWYAAVVLFVIACMMVGVTLTVGTGALLLALCVVPPGIMVMLWPGLQPPTAADVLYGRERRG
jgi:hypothetical protein